MSAKCHQRTLEPGPSDLHGNRPALLCPPADKISRKESSTVGPGSHYWGRVSAPGVEALIYLISHVVLCGMSIDV